MTGPGGYVTSSWSDVGVVTDPAAYVEHLTRYTANVWGRRTPYQESARAAFERAAREQAARREAAQHQAVELLLSLLAPAEQHRYKLWQRFEVRGSGGGLYEVHHGYSGNIYMLSPECRRLCAHPPMVDAPVEFAMVVQLLAISADEDDFLRVALPA